MALLYFLSPWAIPSFQVPAAAQSHHTVHSNQTNDFLQSLIPPTLSISTHTIYFFREYSKLGNYKLDYSPLLKALRVFSSVFSNIIWTFTVTLGIICCNSKLWPWSYNQIYSYRKLSRAFLKYVFFLNWHGSYQLRTLHFPLPCLWNACFTLLPQSASWREN